MVVLVPVLIIGNTVMRTVLDFCHGLPEKLFKPDDILLAEGGEDKKLYILIEGELEVLKGETKVNTHSEPGAIFGELAVLLDIPHTATVRAVIPSRTYQVHDAEAFLESNPDLAFQLSILLAKRLNSITTYLVDLKNQFEDQQDHFGMVDEVLETLLNQQVENHFLGSERYPDASILANLEDR
jgi:CRP/FNR family cyclic AMP-dependent transcriptional regulator